MTPEEIKSERAYLVAERLAIDCDVGFSSATPDQIKAAQASADETLARMKTELGTTTV